MPTYDFYCSVNKDHKYTEVRGMNDPQTRTTCTEDGCEGTLMRVFSAPPITFKGTGFSSNTR